MRRSGNICKALIQGQIMKYDYCGAGDLEQSKKYHGTSCVYIGSGKVYSINGVIQEGIKGVPKNIEHFFIKMDKFLE